MAHALLPAPLLPPSPAMVRLFPDPVECCTSMLPLRRFGALEPGGAQGMGGGTGHGGGHRAWGGTGPAGESFLTLLSSASGATSALVCLQESVKLCEGCCLDYAKATEWVVSSERMHL